MSIVGTYPAERKPVGYRQLAVSSTAVDLADATGGIPKFAGRAVITVETDTVRWTDDGVTTPTATVGMPAAKDTTFELPSAEAIANFKAIRVTTDAKINIAYYKS